MGRELRRKQAKKEGKSLIKEEATQTDELKRLLFIVFVVVGVLSIIYLASALFITKELKWFNKNENGENLDTVSNSILASAIFKQSEEEYYVYFYDFNEKENIITEMIDQIEIIDKVYKVNTASDLNSNYVSEQSNKDAKTLSDLRVKAPTLIKIIGDEITEYYENDEIKDFLN